MAGSWGHASSFSFYIAHNIQAGELGAVCTDDPEVARRIRKIKANGRVCDCAVCTRPEGKCPKFREGKGDWDPRFLHDEVGYNFKTTEFSAAIAAAQVEVQVEGGGEIARKRRENVRTLNDLLARHSSLLRLPHYSDDVSYLGYPLVIRDPVRLNRERLQLALEAEGVETRPLFGCIPVHQPAYAHLRKEYQGKLPNAEYIGANGFYIGCHQYLTREDLDNVADAFGKAVEKVSR
jgi:CDP-6-deoxy-D-xylo-4-hexulose-3-dehydrase